MAGLKITFEREAETNQLFAHIYLLDGKPFGKAHIIKQHIPVGTWVTVPPSLQPSITWLLVKKCGFKQVTRLPIDGEWHDVIVKAE